MTIDSVTLLYPVYKKRKTKHIAAYFYSCYTAKNLGDREQTP